MIAGEYWHKALPSKVGMYSSQSPGDQSPGLGGSSTVNFGTPFAQVATIILASSPQNHNDAPFISINKPTLKLSLKPLGLLSVPTIA
jgi:hypothetical protein